MYLDRGYPANVSPAVRKRRKLQHLPKSAETRQEQVPQTKNTVAVLNELKRNLVYKVESQTGPVHAPIFTISVVVDGQKFVGSGPSKKLARVAAAASALRSFIQFKDGATLTPIEPLQNVDFTSDDPMIENSIFPLSDAVPIEPQEKSITTNGKPLPETTITVNLSNSTKYNSNVYNITAANRQSNVCGNAFEGSVSHSINHSKKDATRETNVGNSSVKVMCEGTRIEATTINTNTSTFAGEKLLGGSDRNSTTTTGYLDACAGSRTTTAAGSNIATNMAATGANYNDCHDQCISGSIDGVATSTVTAASDISVHNTSCAATADVAVTFPNIPEPAASTAATIGCTNSPPSVTNTPTTTTIVLMLPSTDATSESERVVSAPAQLSCLCSNGSSNTPPAESDRLVVPCAVPKSGSAPGGIKHCTPSAAADFHRYVNNAYYDSFHKVNNQHPIKQPGCSCRRETLDFRGTNHHHAKTCFVRNTLNNTNVPATVAPAVSPYANEVFLKREPSEVGVLPVFFTNIGVRNTINNISDNILAADTAPVSGNSNSAGEKKKYPSESHFFPPLGTISNLVAPVTTTKTTTTQPSSQCPANGNPSAQNGQRQVVEKIQQSLDLFKNSNEKAVAWKKRFEKLKVSATNIVRNSATVAAGHHPKSQPEKGPVMLLHELFTDAHFECVSSDGLQHSKFTVVVTVNDNQRFEGTGPSKKMAKNAAAKAALASICNISFSPLQQSKFGLINAGTSNGAIGGTSGISVNGENAFKSAKNFELPQTFADAIGKLVIEKFNLVMQGSDVYSRRKVLAGFVMTQGYDVKTARVISLATGTKCVSGEHMSVTGSVINDSHAEIIARRGLMDFFYTQLDLLCRHSVTGEESSPKAPITGTGSSLPGTSSNVQEKSIFNKPSIESALYTLKDGIYFHLYINTAPCGDARVFSPHENDSMDVDKHPNRKARGQLRTKVESGEGTIPVKSSEGIQTWDGVLQGQRLLTMSCSDKISRWNVLGLQGSLLASIIQPIYLHSIVLGSLLHPAHMYRAICGRIENAIQGLPPPYRLNKPKLALMTSAESRNQTKPPNFSINWITDCTEVEIVNSFTGKLINNNNNTSKMSRLSKQSFYRRYTTVIAQLPHVGSRELKPTYFETKMSVVEYQLAKRELFAAFSKEDLGDWLKKPIEQDQFTLLTAKETDPQYGGPQQPIVVPPPPASSLSSTVAVGSVCSETGKVATKVLGPDRPLYPADLPSLTHPFSVTGSLHNPVLGPGPKVGHVVLAQPTPYYYQ
ncbi:uncharacterized protein LOC131213399 [Anopheles bellator]|uniref:uncharacterized protein LOC131213399 n=1 Tax=Anopheles bellator TaxID=139047 RepID=UPI002649017C|nr:uncharacterized protein LOC131213399 [Anopheles bellator]